MPSLKQDRKSISKLFSTRVSDADTLNWSHETRRNIVPYVKSRFHRVIDCIAMNLCGKDKDPNFMEKREARINSEAQLKALHAYHKRRLRESRKQDKLERAAKRDAVKRRKKNKKMKNGRADAEEL